MMFRPALTTGRNILVSHYSATRIAAVDPIATAGGRAGDLCIVIAVADDATFASPAGWTTLGSITSGTPDLAVFSKTLAGSETSVTFMSTTDESYLIHVFLLRGVGGLTLAGFQSQSTTGDPTLQTIAVTSAKSPAVAFAVGAALNALISGNLTFTQGGSPAADSEHLQNDQVGATDVYSGVKYKVFRGALANIDADLGDLGVGNTLASFYVTSP